LGKTISQSEHTTFQSTRGLKPPAIPAICLERGSYRLQDLFDLRLDGIRHENTSVIECFEPVKKLGGFYDTSQPDGRILKLVAIGGPLAIRERYAKFLQTYVSCALDVRIRESR